MADFIIFSSSILFLTSLFKDPTLIKIIFTILWISAPILISFILRKRFTSLVKITRKPRKLVPLKIFDILKVFIPLCAFGWVSALIIIQVYIQARKEERKNTPWWRLKEYGGKF
jgi:hypothetical protein